VLNGSAVPYARFLTTNLLADTVAHTWTFTAHVQNLLEQPVGTLNRTTVTGVKVFVTDLHATAGTGTVSIANADGTETFTAPNQPYFYYNQIVASTGDTGDKLWMFNVPNTVTDVSMSIMISADFPAEQNVTALPPTSYPDWINSDTNVSQRTDSVHVRFLKRVLVLRFRSAVTLSDRQLAVAYVNGTVIGGSQNPDGSGFYYIQMPSDTTGANLFSASKRLQSLPQVENAYPEVLLEPIYLTPRDGGEVNGGLVLNSGYGEYFRPLPSVVV